MSRPNFTIPTDAGQAIVIRQRPILLDEHDLHFTDAARHKAALHKTMKVIGAMLAPLAVAQALAFGGFIYEESLQACSFGVRSALIAEDQALAYDGVKRFESMMRSAQWYQDHFGCLAFWSHESFRQYFYVAAPTQLAGFYCDGKRLALWGDDVRRWQERFDTTGKSYAVDTFKENGTERLRSYGFDPEIIDNPKHCLACRESYDQKLIDSRPAGKLDRRLSWLADEHAAKKAQSQERRAYQNLLAKLAEGD